MNDKRNCTSEFDRLGDLISKLAAYVAVLMLLLLTLLIFVSIIARSFFNNPLSFTEEVSAYLSVGIIALGLAHTLKEKGHIQVQIISSHFPSKLKRILDPILVIIGFAWAVPLAVGALQFWYRNWTEEVTSWGGLQIPVWIPSLVLPLGCFILLLQMVIEFRKSKRS
jgi:TRAP-type C4-dicarboxylate transport system permease small subunit